MVIRLHFDAGCDGAVEQYDVEAMLRASSARLVVAEGRILALLGETLAAWRPPLGARTLAELRHDGRLASDGRPEDLALIQFSSGTTVEPKPVALSQRAVLAQVSALNALWPAPATPEQPSAITGVSWLPLYHDMGLIGCIFPALERPSVLTLLPPEAFVARPALWLRALGRHRGTISPAPNFAYALATERVRDDELDGVDLSELTAAERRIFVDVVNDQLSPCGEPTSVASCSLDSRKATNNFASTA